MLLYSYMCAKLSSLDKHGATQDMVLVMEVTSIRYEKDITPYYARHS
jgi:hypothetical protein